MLIVIGMGGVVICLPRIERIYCNEHTDREKSKIGLETVSLANRKLPPHFSTLVIMYALFRPNGISQLTPLLLSKETSVANYITLPMIYALGERYST